MRVFWVLGFMAVVNCPAQTFEALHYFAGSPADGANPMAKLVMGAKGLLYGTAQYGGSIGQGAVFAATPPQKAGDPWSETVIHSFASNGTDGYLPLSKLAIGPDGSLYGTTLFGGLGNFGTVFQLSPPQAGGLWTETILHNFTGGEDGGSPYGGVIFGTDGKLYGAAEVGGTSGYGVVFSLAARAQAGGDWTEAVIYNFQGGSDGIGPAGELVFGAEGGLYGTTGQGGNVSGQCRSGCGTVFELAPAGVGVAWSKTTIHSFSVTSDGFSPVAGLVVGPQGELYGATFGGGVSNRGIIFELTPVGGGQWMESILFSFASIAGASPTPSPLTLGPGGALYGTTAGQLGAAYRLLPPGADGGGWTPKVLHKFEDQGDGFQPFAVIVGRDGALYGATSEGGPGLVGVLYRLTP